MSGKQYPNLPERFDWVESWLNRDDVLWDFSTLAEALDTAVEALEICEDWYESDVAKEALKKIQGEA